MRERKLTAFVRTNGYEPEKDLGLVWVNCPHEEEMTRLVEEALREKVHVGKEPPPKEDPCCVILCTNSRDVVSDIRRLRFQAPEIPLVVFCCAQDTGFVVEQALQAGASGFVHAGMHPKKIALALSLACEGEIIIPRELLAELLGHRLFLRRPKLLDP